MSIIDKEFKRVLSDILEKGKEYTNERRGVKRLQIPSCNIRHELKDGFPLVSLKQTPFKNVVTELIWFLRGNTNIKYLNENKNYIWNPDAYNLYKKLAGHTALSYDEFNDFGIGSVGKNYSYQWRNFNGKIDQIDELIKGMKADIMGSRLIVTAWNPSELNDTALPPCHNFFQVVGVPLENGNFGFELHFNMRSWDYFLGASYNLASYALLALILENITGYKALAIECNAHCVHLYDNSITESLELIKRDENGNNNCEVIIKKQLNSVQDFNTLEYSDFELKDYTYFDAMKVKMIAPKEI